MSMHILSDPELDEFAGLINQSGPETAAQQIQQRLRAFRSGGITYMDISLRWLRFFGTIFLFLYLTLLGQDTLLGQGTVLGQDTVPGAQSGNAHAASNTFTYLPLLISPASPDWLVYVNYHRQTADLPPVAENPDWSNGNVLHGRYSVKNDILMHDEDPANPWYTPEGQAAARASNLSGSYDANADYLFAIDSWMQAPFHAIGILDPALHRVGYGDYRDPADAGLKMSAGLDVIRGLSTIPNTVQFPIMWPADGMMVSLALHWGEYPSPLTSCPGYRTPSGLPLILQIGPGNLIPAVTSHSLTQNAVPVEHCLFDETSYANPVAAQQALGRAIMNSRDAIVIIPRAPLDLGATYSVSVTANGNTYSWSFSVSAAVFDSANKRYEYDPERIPPRFSGAAGRP